MLFTPTKIYVIFRNRQKKVGFINRMQQVLLIKNINTPCEQRGCIWIVDFQNVEVIVQV